MSYSDICCFNGKLEIIMYDIYKLDFDYYIVHILQWHKSFQLPPSTISSTSIPLTVPKEQKLKEEDRSQVQFLGPIPDPVKLPPKWKCAKDKYGRPYYYHVKIRKSQWIPPPLTETPSVEEAECKYNNFDYYLWSFIC